MSQPIPDAVKRPSVFPVPEHVASVIVGGGCSVAHVPQNGAVDCAACYPNGSSFIFSPAPVSAQEQSDASSAAVEPQPPASPQEPAPAVVPPAAAAPAPVDAPAEAPVKASKKPAADASSA